MNEKYLVSIITPCLNSEKTIRDTIESVLYQTYGNIEYVIIDGGSTDNTLDIILEYQPLFRGRMHYVSEPDKGIYDAMNKGIKLSHGKVIGIINSDDYYELNAIENIVTHMNIEKYQVIYGYCRIICNGHAKSIAKRSHNDLKQGMIPHPTCFITRETYKKFGIFLNIYKIAGDYELLLRLYVSKKVRFIQINQIIASFRMNGISSNIKLAKREKAVIKYCYQLISFKDMIVELIRNI